MNKSTVGHTGINDCGESVSRSNPSGSVAPFSQKQEAPTPTGMSVPRIIDNPTE